MFDFASNVSEGVRNTTTLFDREALDRFRRPRFIAKDGVVRQYTTFEADGQYALRQASDGKYFRENYVFHLDLPGKEKIVVLTYDRILRITLASLRVDWDVHFHQVDTITLERAGISIVLRDGATGPFIPAPNKDDREKFFRLLAHVVEDYNSRMEGSVVSSGPGGGRLSRWTSRASGYNVDSGWH
jgi:vacuolar protein sorting-associated protein 13A/C